MLGPNVVMLPIPRGQKCPRVSGWQKTTLAAMSDPQYLASFVVEGNIGILLGKPSGNVCAIDIDDDAFVEPFLAANPKLRGSLRTRGKRGCQVWVQLPEGDTPRSRKLETKSGHPWGEWRSDGNQSVIYGRHPAGVPYVWDVDAAAVEITFDEIVWPDDVKHPWGDRAFRELIAEVGEPVNGTTTNPSFFARAFRHRYPVAVHGQGLCLYSPDTGLWEVLDEKQSGKRLWPFTRGMLDAIDAGGLKSRLKTTAITEILNLLLTEGEALKTPENRTLIHLKNGMLDLSECEPRMLAFAPGYGSRHRLEIDYLPGAPCPKFLEWLRTTMQPDDVFLFQQWFGAVMLGANLGQRMLLIHGDASAGKSQLLSLVEKVVGVENCQQLRMAQLNSRFEMREYKDRVLLTGTMNAKHRSSAWPAATRVKSDGACVGRCPACAEHGQDAKGEHLWWDPATGAFACVANPNDREHRQQIFALVGLPPGAGSKPSRPRYRPVCLGKPVWAGFGQNA